MAISLEHVFVITKPDANEAQRLIDIGFNEGRANVQPGQGKKT